MSTSRTKFTTTVTGFAQDRNLRKRQEKTYTGRSLEESRMSLDEEMQNYTLEAVRVQRTLGLDVPDIARSDYPDEIGAMARSISGFQLDLSAGGMSRHSITNTYISKPSVSGTVKFDGSIISPETLGRAGIGNDDNKQKLKISLPGIYTLAARTTKPDSKTFDSLLETLIPVYNDVLTTFDTEFVQFNEFELLKNPTIDNIERIKSIYQRVSFPGKKILAFYFGDIRPIVEHLDELPAEVIHLDVFHGSNADQLLHRVPRSKEIVLGLLDTVQYTSDHDASVIRTAKKFAEKIDPTMLWLSTNGDLVYRGRNFAESKITTLVRIANKLRS